MDEGVVGWKSDIVNNRRMGLWTLCALTSSLVNPWISRSGSVLQGIIGLMSGIVCLGHFR